MSTLYLYVVRIDISKMNIDLWIEFSIIIHAYRIKTILKPT